MIAGCPNCKARYRIERDKLVDGAVRLRCTKCEAVFKVRAPEEPAAAPKAPAPMEVAPPRPEPPPRPAARPEPPAPDVRAPAGPVAAPGAPAPSAVPPSRPPRPSGPTVLVALPDEELAKRTGAALEERGLATIVVFDGVEAMLAIQREIPAAVVLAADLPKMFGFQVCEVIQRNESLRHIHVVLAGAIHHPDRYRRPPEELYGADSYIEAPDLPDGVFPILDEAGLLEGVGAAPPAPPAPQPGPGPARAVPSEPAPPAAAPPAPEVAPAPAPVPPPAPAAASAPVSEAHAEAERLARIIVSDIVLYNEEKFTQAIADGTVAAVLGPDLVEGRGLFDARIDAAVRADRDFLLDELLRVARNRGMK